MIDVAVNEHGSLFVVHDEKGLVGALALEICRADGEAAIILKNGCRRELTRLAQSMITALPKATAAGIIRMDGFRVAAVGHLALRLFD